MKFVGMGNTIGERIRQYRIINNLSQENVAEELSMSNGNYGKIERGEIDVSSTHLIALAQLFHIEVGEFFIPAKINFAEPKEKIGYVPKEDFNNLVDTVRKLAEEIEKLTRKKSSKPKPADYIRNRVKR